MYICNSGHEEIVYLGSNCSLCYNNNLLENLNNKMTNLNIEVDTLKEELAEKEK